MESELKKWAVTERTFIEQDITWFAVGSKTHSPSGDDITEQKIDELKMRLEHINKILGLSPK